MTDRTDPPKTSRRSVLGAVAVGGAMAVAGCTAEDDAGGADAVEDAGKGDDADGEGDDADGEGDDADDSRGSWVEVQSTEPPNYNVFRILDANSADRIARVKDPLYSIDEDDNVAARIVREYEVSDDFTEFTFTITEHGEWSDPYGRLTAEDVVYSINEVILGDDNWAGASNVSDWRTTPADGEEPVDIDVERTGEFEFTVRLPESRPGFIRSPVLWGSQAFMPKELLEPYVDRRDGAGLNEDHEVQSLSYTGNLGAYDVDTLATEDRMLATRDDDYYLNEHDGFDDAPYFDEFEYRVIREETTRLSALRTGEVTATEIPPRRREEIVNTDGLQVVDVPTAYVSSIVYQHRGNGTWDAWENPAVRRAFTRATDVESIVDEILDGAAEPAYTYLPEWSEFYDDSEVDRIEFDPETARQELAANLPDGYGYDGEVLIEETTGERVTLKYVYSLGVDDVELTARFLQTEYERHLGVDVTLEGVPFDVLVGEYLQVPDPDAAREFDMLAGLDTNTYPLTPEATTQFWDPEFNAVLGGYPDPKGVHELLEAAERETDRDRRQRLLAEAFGVLSAEQPFNFLYFSDRIHAYQDDVEFSEEPSPWWGYDMNRWRFRQG